jgi:hypothetical protein
MAKSKAIWFLLVVCLSSAASADRITTENLSGDGLATANEAPEAPLNPPADTNSPVDDLSNLIVDDLSNSGIPIEETGLEGQEGEPVENDELEEEHEYFDHIDANKGG